MQKIYLFLLLVIPILQACDESSESEKVARRANAFDLAGHYIATRAIDSELEAQVEISNQSDRSDIAVRDFGGANISDDFGKTSTIRVDSRSFALGGGVAVVYRLRGRVAKEDLTFRGSLTVDLSRDTGATTSGESTHSSVDLKMVARTNIVSSTQGQSACESRLAQWAREASHFGGFDLESRTIHRKYYLGA